MRKIVAAAIIIAFCAAPVSADGSRWRDYVTFTLSDRARVELVDWFQPPAESKAARYAFFANQVRAGIRATFPHAQLVVEGQDTRLVALPDDASLAAPFGNLGPGGNYFAHTHDRDQGETFLKQAYLTLRRSGFAATGGRFEYSEALETIPPDPSLAYVKRTRLAERLIGPYGYTHVGRSFDGARVAYDHARWNATAFASHPTHAGFEVSANREIDDVTVAIASVTAKGLPNAPPADIRFFYLFYEDGRGDVVKTDNRPRPVREADREEIRVHSWGGHAATVVPLGPGAIDALAWGTLQAGEWGDLNHNGWAFAVEGGYQLPALPAAPWLRVGIDRSSGDDDPNDFDHKTFFQVLPTARTYAQFPFYNLMNNQDVFAELILKPHARVLVRTDYHWLRVSEGRDLWYSGAGATNDDVFGYSGPSAGGHRELAHVVDASVSISLHQRLSMYLYYAHAFGQEVVEATYAGADADYGYMDVTFRY